ncbi:MULTISPECIES: hypothetical protein [Pseudomonas]|jgi:hypothetical protein|nr:MULTISPECIES: hypothetical protein [Pseudomonas]
MKIMFWVLAGGLLIVMASYNVARDSSSTCQPPQSTTYKVFQ